MAGNSSYKSVFSGDSFSLTDAFAVAVGTTFDLAEDIEYAANEVAEKVEYAVDSVEYAADGVQQFGSDMYGLGADAMNAVSQTAHDMGDAISHGLETAENALSSATDFVMRPVYETAQGAEIIIDSAVDTLSAGANSAMVTIGDAANAVADVGTMMKEDVSWAADQAVNGVTGITNSVMNTVCNFGNEVIEGCGIIAADAVEGLNNAVSNKYNEVLAKALDYSEMTDNPSVLIARGVEMSTHQFATKLFNDIAPENWKQEIAETNLNANTTEAVKSDLDLITSEHFHDRLERKPDMPAAQAHAIEQEHNKLSQTIESVFEELKNDSSALVAENEPASLDKNSSVKIDSTPTLAV